MRSMKRRGKPTKLEPSKSFVNLIIVVDFCLRYLSTEQVLKRQDVIIEHLKVAEQTAKQELVLAKKHLQESKSENESEALTSSETQQRLKQSDRTIDGLKKKNMELLARCDDLSKKLQAERKLRYEIFINTFLNSDNMLI